MFPNQHKYKCLIYGEYAKMFHFSAFIMYLIYRNRKKPLLCQTFELEPAVNTTHLQICPYAQRNY